MTPPHRHPDVTELQFFGGAETDQLILVDHDPAWRDVFSVHAARVRARLGDTVVDLHHVGSTSVAGLAAKPVVDMLLLVTDITAEEHYLEPLVTAGYVLRVREPRHRMLRTPARDVHLHVHEAHDPEATELLLFRDRLRTDETDRALYEATKRELIARDWTHVQAYADAKDEVVATIKARARSQT